MTKASKSNNEKSNKRKLQLFEGLSESDRRKIRKDQRRLKEEIQNKENLTELEVSRQANNELFTKKVVYTREAVLDADNQELITKKLGAHMEKLAQVPRFDSLKLVQKLSQKCRLDGGGGMDWTTLGVQAGVCFNAVPRTFFLAGALETQVTLKKKAKQRQRRTGDEEVTKAIQPENVVQTSTDNENKLSAMEKLVRKIQSTLKKRTTEESDGDGRPKLDAIQFLCNPESFTQTVENIFNFSFLIKKGEAAIGVDKDRWYVQKQNAGGDIVSTQAVCSFTMDDWRRLTAQQQVADLPHRKGGKQHE